jgi:hypothetical protein
MCFFLYFTDFEELGIIFLGECKVVKSVFACCVQCVCVVLSLFCIFGCVQRSVCVYSCLAWVVVCNTLVAKS